MHAAVARKTNVLDAHIVVVLRFLLTLPLSPTPCPPPPARFRYLPPPLSSFHVLHTIRLTLFLLVLVGTHTCMRPLTCMHAAHAHMQTRTEARHADMNTLEETWQT